MCTPYMQAILMLYVLPVVLFISTPPLLPSPRGSAWQNPVLRPKLLTAWAVAIHRRASMPFFPPRATIAGSYFRVPFAFFFSLSLLLPSILSTDLSGTLSTSSWISLCVCARVAIMASPAIKKAITEAALTYSKPEGTVFEYGTAGVCAPRSLFVSFSPHSIPVSNSLIVLLN